MSDELRETQRRIYDLGEIERDAERLALEGKPGGLWAQFYLWIARVARKWREEDIELRDEIYREIRDEERKQQ